MRSNCSTSFAVAGCCTRSRNWESSCSRESIWSLLSDRTRGAFERRECARSGALRRLIELRGKPPRLLDRCQRLLRIGDTRALALAFVVMNHGCERDLCGFEVLRGGTEVEGIQIDASGEEPAAGIADLKPQLGRVQP